MAGFTFDDERDLDPHEEVLLAYMIAPDRSNKIRRSPVRGVLFDAEKSLCQEITTDIRATTVKGEVYNELAGYGGLALSEAQRMRDAASSVEGWIFAAYSANLELNDWTGPRPLFPAFAGAYIRRPEYGFLLMQDPSMLDRYPAVPFDLAEFAGWSFCGPLVRER